MKKILFIILTILLVLPLVACEINWFGDTVEVEWYYIIVPIIIICIVGYIIMMRSYYECAHCGAIFRPKWYHFFVALHFCKKRLVKCPHCGKTSYSRRIKNKRR